MPPGGVAGGVAATGGAARGPCTHQPEGVVPRVRGGAHYGGSVGGQPGGEREKRLADGPRRERRDCGERNKAVEGGGGGVKGKRKRGGQREWAIADAEEDFVLGAACV